jgi:hypothetical protein
MGHGRVVLVGGAAALAVWLGAAGAASADVIDGNWCAGDGRTLSIAGPRIITPGGSALTGDYSRHRFAYTVPPPEAGAGAQVSMQLLNEDTVRLVAGRAPEEIWHRCDVTS